MRSSFQRLKQPLIKSNKCLNSVLYSSPSLWNKLPIEIKRSGSTNSFKHNVKIHSNKNGAYQFVKCLLNLWGWEHLLCAIFKPVYRFGMPNADPRILCKVLSPFVFAEPREQCFKLLRMYNSQNFPERGPCTPLGRVSINPWLSSCTMVLLLITLVEKPATPKKLLNAALIYILIVLFTNISAKLPHYSVI